MDTKMDVNINKKPFLKKVLQNFDHFIKQNLGSEWKKDPELFETQIRFRNSLKNLTQIRIRNNKFWIHNTGLHLLKKYFLMASIRINLVRT
jgi:hypothetical protein